MHWYDPGHLRYPGLPPPSGIAVQNTLRGPGLVNGDAGLDKRFTIKERYNFAFRMEMYNVGNTPHHASPGYTVQTSTTSNNNVNNSLFMHVSNQIANTGRDGIDQRTLRFSV